MQKSREEIVLEQAAEIIEQRGWRQGNELGPLTDLKHPVCAAEAINVADFKLRIALGRPLASKAMDLFRERAMIPPAGGIASWNDQPGRTREEVLAIMRGTIVG